METTLKHMKDNNFCKRRCVIYNLCWTGPSTASVSLSIRLTPRWQSLAFSHSKKKVRRWILMASCDEDPPPEGSSSEELTGVGINHCSLIPCQPSFRMEYHPMLLLRTKVINRTNWGWWRGDTYVILTCRLTPSSGALKRTHPLKKHQLKDKQSTTVKWLRRFNTHHWSVWTGKFLYWIGWLLMEFSLILARSLQCSV